MPDSQGMIVRVVGPVTGTVAMRNRILRVRSDGFYYGTWSRKGVACVDVVARLCEGGVWMTRGDVSSRAQCLLSTTTCPW